MTGSMMTTVTLIGSNWSVVCHWCNMRNMGNWSYVVRETSMGYGSGMMIRCSCHVDWLGEDLVDRLSNFHVGWHTADDGIKSVVVVGMIVYNAMVTVSIQESVLSPNFISMTALVLTLDISGVAIVHRIGELVVSRCMMFGLLYNSVMDWCSVISRHVMHRSSVGM